MATQKRIKTRFNGVFYRITQDHKRKHNGRPDRVFDICWRDANGKRCWEVAGWLTEGMTEQAASNIRAERLVSAKQPVPFSSVQPSKSALSQTAPLPEASPQTQTMVSNSATVAAEYMAGAFLAAFNFVMWAYAIYQLYSIYDEMTKCTANEKILGCSPIAAGVFISHFIQDRMCAMFKPIAQFNSFKSASEACNFATLRAGTCMA